MNTTGGPVRTISRLGGYAGQVQQGSRHRRRSSQGKSATHRHQWLDETPTTYVRSAAVVRSCAMPKASRRALSPARGPGRTQLTEGRLIARVHIVTNTGICRPVNVKNPDAVPPCGNDEIGDNPTMAHARIDDSGCGFRCASGVVTVVRHPTTCLPRQWRTTPR
jgi:hypothetical protein